MRSFRLLAGLCGLLGLSAVSVTEAMALGQLHPPCVPQPQPFYSELSARPALQVVRDEPMNAAWVPPVCTGWTKSGYRMLVALAATFRFHGSGDDLLARFGDVSAFKDIKYWTASDRRWRILIADAVAVDGHDSRHRRPDFTAAELRTGKDLYFLQDDSRSSGSVLYQMQVLEIGPKRLVVAIENASPVRAFLMTLFHPGDLQFLYFLDARGPGIWGLYSLTRTGRGASSLSSGHENSYVSRAVAFYRHFAGIPTDQNPPVLFSDN
jgi:uncharacterized protein DUF6675